MEQGGRIRLVAWYMTVCCIPPPPSLPPMSLRYHQHKFIVDSKWMLSCCVAADTDSASLHQHFMPPPPNTHTTSTHLPTHRVWLLILTVSIASVPPVPHHPPQVPPVQVYS